MTWKTYRNVFSKDVSHWPLVLMTEGEVGVGSTWLQNVGGSNMSREQGPLIGTLMIVD